MARDNVVWTFGGRDGSDQATDGTGWATAGVADNMQHGFFATNRSSHRPRVSTPGVHATKRPVHRIAQADRRADLQWPNCVHFWCTRCESMSDVERADFHGGEMDRGS